MDRLGDRLESDDQLEVGAAKLLRAAIPPAPSDLSKKRVLAAVSTQTPKRRRLGLGLRTAFAGVIFFGSLAAASAMFGRSWFADKSHARQHESLPESRATSAVRPFAPLSPSPLPLAPTPPSPTPPKVILSDKLSDPQLPHTPVPRPSESPSRTHANSTRSGSPAVASSEEMSGLLAGFNALRREHDPTRADALLTRYMKRYPNGALHEEALALAIEATASCDPPRGLRLAAQYLDRYPNGRFAETARNVKQEKVR